MSKLVSYTEEDRAVLRLLLEKVFERGEEGMIWQEAFMDGTYDAPEVKIKRYRILIDIDGQTN